MTAGFFTRFDFFTVYRLIQFTPLIVSALALSDAEVKVSYDTLLALNRLSPKSKIWRHSQTPGFRLRQRFRQKEGSSSWSLEIFQVMILPKA